MTTTTLNINECVTALIEAFPIADIWLLEGAAFPDAELPSLSLVAIVPQEEASHLIEPAANALLRDRYGPDAPAVSVFPRSAVERLPRPLLVKWALGKGKYIHCG